MVTHLVFVFFSRAGQFVTPSPSPFRTDCWHERAKSACQRDEVKHVQQLILLWGHILQPLAGILKCFHALTRSAGLLVLNAGRTNSSCRRRNFCILFFEHFTLWENIYPSKLEASFGNCMQILSGEYFLSHDKLSLARADPLSSHFCSSMHANITCECLRGCVFQVIHVVGSCLVLSHSRLCLLLASVTDRSTTIKMRIGILQKMHTFI